MYPNQGYPYQYPQDNQMPPMAPPPRKTGLKVLGVLIGFMVVAASFAGGAAFWQATHPVGQSAQPATEEKDEDEGEAKTETITVNLLSSPPDAKAGDPVATRYLSLTAPTAWRTIDNVPDLKPDAYGADFKSSDVLARLMSIPSHPDRMPQYSSLTTSNKLTLLRVEDWLKTESQLGGAAVTDVQKQAYYDFIDGLKTADGLQAASCKVVIGGSFMTPCDRTVVQPKLIATADKSLEGVAFIGLAPDGTTYAPSVIVLMAGKINKSKVFAQGNFALLDEQYDKLMADGEQTDAEADKIKKAVDAMKSGKLTAEQTSLYKEVQDMIKSIKVSDKAPKQ
ncbi:hypothetical protein JNJ66_01610 [Candidatus Saccharibacteria bacterium]|nr:hypothetical protein [Candidatus Saccharibacteria bacterium]